jgi:hypothetical protein
MTASRRENGDQPVPGDVLIARDTTDQNRCTLSVVPGPPQVCCATFDEAVSTALAWASNDRVHVWWTDDGRTFTRIRNAARATS